MTQATLHHPHYWNEAKAFLTENDPLLAPVITTYPGELLQSRGDGFQTLARSIIGQQISVAAADSVWRKFEAQVQTVAPEQVMQQEEEQLRSAGLSRSKVVYLKDLARHFLENPRFMELNHLEDEEIIRLLTGIHGIGRWTAEMFLIFHLMRPDVLPVADLGLQKAVWKRYFNGEKQPLSALTALGAQWKPYRSVATWYLWRSLDPIPVAY